MQILAASQADYVAFESGRLRQGLLTYALVTDAINSAQHEHAVDDMSLRTWLEHPVERLPEIQRMLRNGQDRLTASAHGGIREVFVQTSGQWVRAHAYQQPVLLDFTTESTKITLLPGFRQDYRFAGEDELAKAKKALTSGDADGALKHYNEASNWFFEASDLQRIAAVYQAIGDVLAGTGNNTQARSNYEKAITIFDKIGAHLDQAGSFERLGETLEANGNQPDALKSYLTSIELGRRYGAAEITAKAINKIANLYSTAGEDDIATAYRGSVTGMQR
jgi:tetratricopeptide (TPR) repeat protein